MRIGNHNMNSRGHKQEQTGTNQGPMRLNEHEYAQTEGTSGQTSVNKQLGSTNKSQVAQTRARKLKEGVCTQSSNGDSGSSDKCSCISCRSGRACILE